MVEWVRNSINDFIQPLTLSPDQPQEIGQYLSDFTEAAAIVRDRDRERERETERERE
jgi:hypothetical protein